MPYHVYKRPGKLNYWIDIKVKGRGRVRRSAGTPDRKKAEAIAKSVEAKEWQRLIHGDPATLTFAEAVMDYIADGHKDDFLAPLVAHFKDKRVAGIAPGDIRAAAPVIYPGRKPSTWNRQVIVPARAVINHAASKKLATAIAVPAYREMRALRPAPAPDWLPTFVKAAPPRLAALAMFMRVTAARVGQAVALDWNNVDLARGKAIIPAAKGYPEQEASLTPTAIALLANLPGDRKGRVFGFTSRNRVYKPWRAVCTAAGIPYVATHAAGRKGFATAMMRAGVDPKTASELGRWKSVRLMLDVYADADRRPELINDVFESPQARQKKVK